MTPHTVCVGGPLDGLRVPLPAGVRDYFVQLPAAPSAIAGPLFADEPPPPPRQARYRMESVNFADGAAPIQLLILDGLHHRTALTMLLTAYRGEAPA